MRRKTPWLISLIILASLLTSCAQGNSSPALRDYDQKFQNRLADEVEDMDRKKLYPYALEALQDYAGLRAQVRDMK